MTSEEADDEDILVNASSPVPPALAFGVAMTLGAFALFLHVPTSFLHLSRGFDVVRAIGLVARTLVWANIAVDQDPDIDGVVELTRTLLEAGA